MLTSIYVLEYRFNVAFICLKMVFEVLLCEINYIQDFMLSFGAHEYAFFSTKGNNLYPITLSLLKTNQHVAANGKAL